MVEDTYLARMPCYFYRHNIVCVIFMLKSIHMKKRICNLTLQLKLFYWYKQALLKKYMKVEVYNNNGELSRASFNNVP